MCLFSLLHQSLSWYGGSFFTGKGLSKYQKYYDAGYPWTTSVKSNYTYLAQAPIWCSFYGVRCGTESSSLDYRRVTSISSREFPLEGYLTPLGSLAELTTFQVNGNGIGNGISGTIPQSFFSMPKMQTLHLSRNELTGPIPPITSINPQLLQISLENNFLEGSIPESWGMPRLRTLSLSNNRFAGTIPSTLRRSSRLDTLSLRNNQLSGTIPVLDQSSLMFIDFSDNYLTMGSLQEVPLSTFSPTNSIEAVSDNDYTNIRLQSNCLVFRNPYHPSQNVDATHCRGEKVCQNSCWLWYHDTWIDRYASLFTTYPEPSASPTTTPTVAPSKLTILPQDIIAEGLELFAMAKSIPRLQTLDGAFFRLCVYFVHYFTCHRTYTVDHLTQ